MINSINKVIQKSEEKCKNIIKQLKIGKFFFCTFVIIKVELTKKNINEVVIIMRD